jgi:hypothetical protein
VAKLVGSVEHALQLETQWFPPQERGRTNTGLIKGFRSRKVQALSGTRVAPVHSALDLRGPRCVVSGRLHAIKRAAGPQVLHGGAAPPHKRVKDDVLASVRAPI